jgi:hypothetical protein
VLARKDGLCQVPGCTNPIVHLHHIAGTPATQGDGRARAVDQAGEADPPPRRPPPAVSPSSPPAAARAFGARSRGVRERRDDFEGQQNIIFRSDNGSDAISNLLGVCYRHHCMIHAKLMRVWGLAGKRVVFEFRDPKDLKTVRERWVTEGMDDTRRVEASEAAGASPGEASRRDPRQGLGGAVGVSEGRALLTSAG